MEQKMIDIFSTLPVVSRDAVNILHATCPDDFHVFARPAADGATWTFVVMHTPFGRVIGDFVSKDAADAAREVAVRLWPKEALTEDCHVIMGGVLWDVWKLLGFRESDLLSEDGDVVLAGPNNQFHSA